MKKIVCAVNYAAAWGFLVLDIVRDVPVFLTVTSIVIVVISTLAAWSQPSKPHQALNRCEGCGLYQVRPCEPNKPVRATADDVR